MKLFRDLALAGLQHLRKAFDRREGRTDLVGDVGDEVAADGSFKLREGMLVNAAGSMPAMPSGGGEGGGPAGGEHAKSDKK